MGKNMEQKTCGKGHSPYPQPERGHAKSVDYGSVSTVAQTDAWRAAAPPMWMRVITPLLKTQGVLRVECGGGGSSPNQRFA